MALCIIALTLFQIGVAELIRPAVLGLLGKGKLFARFVSVLTRFALPLFLFHTTGMALSRAVEWTIFGTESEATAPDLQWWLMRPISIIGPLLATLPVIWLFGRRWQNKPVPVTARHPVEDLEVGDGGDEPVPLARVKARRK